ncbi:thioredoxin domain-containing protein [Glaciihabitans sp. UYNi722]|uniref:DsbA family protein n=1 Tax=Glaciihabitans sp. UYNi722 TaxID=3156344 RepID=UPI00339AF1A8
MSNDGSGDDRLSKNQRREVAREKARVLRIEQKKKERRSKFLLQGGLVVVLLAIVTVITLFFVNTVKPAGPGPLNMLSDGIKIGRDFKAAPTAALQPNAKPVPSATNAKDVVDIQVYVDYQCPICGTFESTNLDQIKTWVSSGAATYEVHPISILDFQSLGKKYSTRAANAGACVANYSPNTYFDYSSELFANQPKEGTEGLTDAQLAKLADRAGVKNLSSVTKCIKDQTFKSWVSAASARAATGPIPHSNVKKVANTPTVIIDGKKYVGATDDATAFSDAVVKAVGDTFSDSTPSSPSPSATP